MLHLCSLKQPTLKEIYAKKTQARNNKELKSTNNSTETTAKKEQAKLDSPHNSNRVEKLEVKKYPEKIQQGQRPPRGSTSPGTNPSEQWPPRGSTSPGTNPASRNNIEKQETRTKTLPTTTTNNKNRTPKERNNQKPAQHSKRKENLKKQKNTVTQLRGFWTKYAEEQKLRKAKEEETTRQTSNKETTENKLPTETTIQDAVHCKSRKATMVSYNQVQGNDFILENSNRPAKAMIKQESEINYSRDFDMNRISM